MERFEGLGSFYTYYEKSEHRVITIEDVDELEERLRASGHSVRECKNGTVVVRTQVELETARKRRLSIQMSEAAKYTKLGAAIPIPLAREFSDACRKLGLTQLDILLSLINETIERANKI